MEDDFVIRPHPGRGEIQSVWGMHLEGSDHQYANYGQQRPLFPLITAPMAEKSMSEFVCPPEHTEKAKDFLDTCDKFLIVGSSGWDTDLLEFLASAVTRIPAMVHLVAPTENPRNNRSVDAIRDRYTTGVPAFAAAYDDGKFGVHPKPFTEYLKDAIIAELLED